MRVRIEGTAPGVERGKELMQTARVLLHMCQDNAQSPVHITVGPV